MNKHERALSKRISYEGRDGDVLMFGTDSWTRPGSGIRHKIEADFSTGLMKCDCEDGRVHHKMIDIMTGEGNPCKHLRQVHAMCKHIMEQR